MKIDPLASDGITDLEVYNGTNLELSVVNDSSGGTILLGFINPSAQSRQKIDVESTAKAIIMTGLWAIGLTKDEKLNALSTISTLPNYETFLSEVEQAVLNQNLSNINPILIQNNLREELASKAQNSSITKEFEPLYVIAENNQLYVFPVDYPDGVNVSYSLTLFKENVEIDEKILLGDLNSQEVIDLLFNGNNSGNSKEQIDFDFSVDGNYELIARNGLSLSEDHRTALYHNLSVSLLEVTGVFSGSFKKIFSDNAQCLLEVLNLVRTDLEFQVALDKYRKIRILVAMTWVE